AKSFDEFIQISLPYRNLRYKRNTLKLRLPINHIKDIRISIPAGNATGVAIVRQKQDFSRSIQCHITTGKLK
ncbi:MAG: hypothetical protein V1720_03730, partial [bacterium]